MASARDTITHMKRKAEADIENKLNAKDRDLEETKLQLRSIKDINEQVNEQLAKAVNYQQNKIDDIKRKTDEINIRLYDYATKKDVKTLEERINEIIEEKIVNALKNVNNKISDLKKSMLDDRKELDKEILDLKRSLSSIEIKQEEKFSSLQNSNDATLRQIENDYKGSLKQMKENISKTEDNIMKQLEEDKVYRENVINKKNTESLAEYKKAINYLENRINGTDTIMKKQINDFGTNMKLIEKRDKITAKGRTALEKRVSTLQEKLNNEIKNTKADFKNYVENLSNKQNGELTQKIEDCTQMQEEFANNIEEIKEKIGAMQRAHDEDKEIIEHRRKEDQKQGHDSTIMAKNEEFSGKIIELEERISLLGKTLEKLKSQIREDEKTRNRLISGIDQHNGNLNETIEDLRIRLENVEKNPKSNKDSKHFKDSINQVYLSHEKLSDSFKILEARLNALRADFYNKFENCSKELQYQRDSIAEISHNKPDRNFTRERYNLSKELVTIPITHESRLRSSNNEPIVTRSIKKIDDTIVINKSVNKKYIRDKFTVNLGNLSSVGQEGLNRPFETVDYNSIDFEHYRGESDTDKVIGGSKRSPHIERIAQPFPEHEENVEHSFLH